MVQSIDRAFAILDAVAAQPAGVTAIAKRVELPKSTVARLLAALEQRGAVERPDGVLFRIGPGVAALAAEASAERSVAVAVRPELANLVRMVGESAGLAFPDGYEVRYVDQVESDNAIQVRDWTGTRAPLHAAPSGLVLLAHWPQDAIAAYVAHGLERLTSKTMVEPGDLAQRLEHVRREGIAWGLEEFAEGINSIAAPVRDGDGKPIAAIHCHGPAYRFPAPGREAWVAEQVVKAAAGASAQLAIG
jgi:DNA-binding IclR family transcriptional regulator